MAREFNIKTVTSTELIADLHFTITTVFQDLLSEFTYAELLESNDLNTLISNANIVTEDENSDSIASFGNTQNDALTIVEVPVDDSNKGDGRILKYNIASGKLEYQDENTGSGLNYLETATLDGGTIITPPQMSNDVHDYNPTGFATSVMIRQSISSNGKKITGFVAPAAGVNRIIAVNNISSSGRDIRFEHQDSNSSSANRLYLRDNGARTTRPNETAIFWYDHTSNGWRSYNRIG